MDRPTGVRLTGPMTTHRLLTSLVVLTALGSGVVGGVLFAFSAFVMDGLDRLPPRQAILAMQEINREAPRPPLLIPLMGTFVLCLVLVAVSLVRLRHGVSGPAVLVLVGCGLYLVAFAITAGYHVPHNDALALIDPSASGAAATWHDYARPWELLNHVRAGAAVLGSACLVVSLVR